MTSRRTFLKALSATGFATTAAFGSTLECLPDDFIPHGESDWQTVSAQFGLDDRIRYFNTGGLGPAPLTTINKVCEVIRQLQSTPEHGHALIEEARPVVAEFLGATPEEIAFTRNATEGNSTVAAGLHLEPEDEVIVDAHAHQGGAISWMTRQKYEGIKLRLFDPHLADEATIVSRIEQQLTPRTRVIQVSHVTAPTGILMPVRAIGELAEDRGIWFHIDGAQSVGMLPVEVSKLGCHSYATSGHKWMCGPTGTGVLFVRRDQLDAVQPTDVGSYANATWNLPDELEFVGSARRFECGTRDAATVVGLAESVRFLDAIGVERIHRRGRDLAARFRNLLGKFDDGKVLSPESASMSTPMVTFAWQGKSANALFGHFMKHNCRCRPVREQGLEALRVSLHLFNSKAQLDKLAEALQHL